MFDQAIISDLTLSNEPSARTQARSLSPRALRVSDQMVTKSQATAGRYEAAILAISMAEMERQFFDERVREWIEDTANESSISRIKSHVRFAELVQMRETATRLILERLISGQAYVHYFVVLKAIEGGYDPVPPEKRGFVREMAKSWIDWGRRAGRI